MATNMYIKFEEPPVKGDSTSEGHKEDIEIMSWSHGFTQPTSPVRSTAGSGTVEQANHSNFTFTKYLDSATDDLLKQCWTGKQFASPLSSVYPSSRPAPCRFAHARAAGIMTPSRPADTRVHRHPGQWAPEPTGT